MMQKDAKIYIAGHRGMVGSACMRLLEKRGYSNIIFRTSNELDLTNQESTKAFFDKEKPDYVINAAAKVGGILANSTYPAEFIYDNLMIVSNVIHAAYETRVKKLINLGSSCIFPKMAPQPLKEEYLLTGPLEPTNEAYAVAKIAGIKLCKFYNKQYGTNFISIMPSNLYGPNDNFDLETSHVFPALIRKIHEAKESGGRVTLWGDGSPMRELLYVDDLADAILFLLENYDYSDIGEFINIGTGKEISIKKLAELMAEIMDYTGDFKWDLSKPNGTPRKVLDTSCLENLGWRYSTSLREGIEKTYKWYLENKEN